MALEEKTNRWTLRVFESLWAIQVTFPATDIADFGLERYLAEYRVSVIGYGILAVSYVVAAMTIARVAPNPKVRRLTAVAVMVVATALAFLFPSSWMFAVLVVLALLYYLVPRKEGMSI